MGAVVVALVVGLSLFPRLNAAQNLINDAHPALTADRVAGDRGAIDMVTTAITTTDLIAEPNGGAAAEVPKLIAFVSSKTGLSQAAVLNALQTNFPHTTALLQAVPLSSVSAELPGLITFLATTLKLPRDQVVATLQTNFPHLYQSIDALPRVTGGWNDVPGTGQLTRFDGAPVRTVPQSAAYFSQDVVPVLQQQQTNYTSLAAKGGVGYLDILLLVLGLVVLVFGLAMAYLAARGAVSRGIATVGWGVVTVVGVVVIGLVLGLSLFPRLGNGQNLVNGARAAFDSQRVTGDRAAITMISDVVQAADPIMTPSGGVAAEVPRLITFVSSKTGLSGTAVLGALKANAPHTTALLQAVPLSAVSAEIPKLITFLSTTLKITPAQVDQALATNVPSIHQALVLLPVVTSGWNNVPNLHGLTRFDGTPVRTVPQIRDYFAADVIPVLERQHANFARVDTTWPPLPVFPPLLLVVGILVTVYGLVMLILTLRSAPPAHTASQTAAREPTPSRR
ncbi:MAG TPA: hypothetical protein VGD72_09445 [Mycobacteriales bacterium]